MRLQGDEEEEQTRGGRPRNAVAMTMRMRVKMRLLRRRRVEQPTGKKEAKLRTVMRTTAMMGKGRRERKEERKEGRRMRIGRVKKVVPKERTRAKTKMTTKTRRRRRKRMTGRGEEIKPDTRSQTKHPTKTVFFLSPVQLILTQTQTRRKRSPCRRARWPG